MFRYALKTQPCEPSPPWGAGKFAIFFFLELNGISKFIQESHVSQPTHPHGGWGEVSIY